MSGERNEAVLNYLLALYASLPDDKPLLAFIEEMVTLSVMSVHFRYKCNWVVTFNTGLVAIRSQVCPARVSQGKQVASVRTNICCPQDVPRGCRPRHQGEIQFVLTRWC